MRSHNCGSGGLHINCQNESKCKGRSVDFSGRKTGYVSFSMPLNSPVIKEQIQIRYQNRDEHNRHLINSIFGGHNEMIQPTRSRGQSIGDYNQQLISKIFGNSIGA